MFSASVLDSSLKIIYPQVLDAAPQLTKLAARLAAGETGADLRRDAGLVLFDVQELWRCALRVARARSVAFDAAHFADASADSPSDAAVARYAQAVVPGCKPLCLPECTEYGYAHQSGKDETKMVAEGTKYAASLGIVAGGDDVLLALHSYRVADEKNMAMRFFHASSVL